MTYCQFVQAVEDKVREEVRGKICVTVHTAQKNNGVSRVGLLLSEADNNVSPVIYLEEYYNCFLSGCSLEEIADDVLSLYHQMRLNKPWKEMDIRSYDAVCDRIVYRLINREANEELLREVPHVPYLDLAIVFHVLFSSGENGMASMLIKDDHMKMWQTDCKDIYQKACENTERLLPYDFMSVFAAVEQLQGIDPVRKIPEKEEDMFVLTNQMRSFGASAILYSGRLREIGAYLKEDFYVLPGSVHETIIVRAGMAPEREVLDTIIRDINRTQVEKEEILSDRAYFYDRAHDKLTL